MWSKFSATNYICKKSLLSRLGQNMGETAVLPHLGQRNPSFSDASPIWWGPKSLSVILRHLVIVSGGQSIA